MGDVFFQEINPNQSPISTYGKVILTIRSSQALSGKYDQDRKMSSSFLEYQNNSFLQNPREIKMRGVKFRGGGIT